MRSKSRGNKISSKDFGLRQSEVSDSNIWHSPAVRMTIRLLFRPKVVCADRRPSCMSTPIRVGIIGAGYISARLFEGGEKLSGIGHR